MANGSRKFRIALDYGFLLLLGAREENCISIHHRLEDLKVEFIASDRGVFGIRTPGLRSLENGYHLGCCIF